MEALETRVRDILATCRDPVLSLDLSQHLREVRLTGGRLQVSLEFGFPLGRSKHRLLKRLEPLLREIEGAWRVELEVSWNIFSHAVPPPHRPIPGIKNLIAIASGKGGVGKSTVAVNAALALQLEGAKVGLLDADIYGPSIPKMLGIYGQPQVEERQKIVPKEAYGLKLMSIGFLIEEDTPMIWRGPMATSALRQLLQQTDWGELDYLIVDLPPGTGDIHLTLVQNAPLAGGVIVTTPQEIALIDAMKGLKMFEKVGVTVLGVVENMSFYRCPKCGHSEAIFGEGGGEKLAEKYRVPFLGRLPFDPEIVRALDRGQPPIISDPESETALAYSAMALRMAAELAKRPKDRSIKIGIEVE